MWPFNNSRQETSSVIINLGDRVKDRISGITGIVIGRTDWLYGCRRLSIQPEAAKDGRPADVFNIDEPQAELVDVGVIPKAVPAGDYPVAPHQRTHGPREDAARRSDVNR